MQPSKSGQGLTLDPKHHPLQVVLNVNKKIIRVNQSIKDPHRATHGQGEADPSTATGGSNPCVTK